MYLDVGKIFTLVELSRKYKLVVQLKELYTVSTMSHSSCLIEMFKH